MSAETQPKSTDAVIQTLKWMRKQGFKPVALHKASKASVDRNYVDPKYDPSDDLWLKRDLGIGAVTGPKAGGPTDVDLDCDEAVFFAKCFLPPTSAIFGRKSKPRSHYLYRPEIEELAKKAYGDPLSKDTIIEIRADGGHQTVFPGSIHEGTGELIEWSDHAFPDVPRVEVGLLEFAVKKVAIATLITRHMWADGQRNEICKHLSGMFYYLEWGIEETKSMISAIMEYTGDTDRTRLRTVGITYGKGEKGGKVTGSNTLRSFLGDDRLVDRILEWAGNTSAALLQDYNERFAVVSMEGKFRIAETSVIEKGQPPTFFGKEDFLNIMATDTITIDEKKVPRARVWLANPRRRSYRSVDFIPGVEDTSPILNLWTGWAMEPDPSGSCQAWLDLLYYTICGGDDTLYQWMLHWFANIVREPLEKSMTAPVLIGVQGAGKSMLMDYFGAILGSAYIKVTNEEHIYGRFNKHLATTLMLHSEEALFGGDKKHRGIIKSLITDETRIFEQKGIDAKHVKNFMRLALTSNEAHAAPAEVGDRRFTVIEMGQRKVKPELIKAFLEEKRNKGPQALFHHLLHMDYDPMIPRTNVKNEALGNMKQINLDPVQAWWLDTLKQGQVLPDYMSWATKPQGKEWPERVSAHALYVSMLLRSRERGGKAIPDRIGFATLLDKMVGVKLHREQRYFTNPMADDAPREVKLLPSKHYTIMNMPNLAECRAAFCAFIGQEIEWPQEPGPDERPVHVEF